MVFGVVKYKEGMYVLLWYLACPFLAMLCRVGKFDVGLRDCLRACMVLGKFKLFFFQQGAGIEAWLGLLRLYIL